MVDTEFTSSEYEYERDIRRDLHNRLDRLPWDTPQEVREEMRKNAVEAMYLKRAAHLLACIDGGREAVEEALNATQHIPSTTHAASIYERLLDAMPEEELE